MEKIKMAEKEVQVISPPKIQSMMSGVMYATVDNKNNLTLHYQDGTKESAACTDDEFSKFDNFFNVVSHVQSRR